MPSNCQRETRTVSELLQTETRALEKNGVDDPRLDAELLLADLLDCNRAHLLAHPERTVPPEARRRFERLIERRAAREPLQYLLGEWEFCGRTFVVNDSVLIPRPETELLVEECLHIVPMGRPARTADVGTGSGAIAVTLAADRPALDVVAVDADAAAVEVARQNARRHEVAHRVRFVKGDLCRPLKAGSLDLVASNPPYIPTDRLRTLQPEVRDYEPRGALDGGPDGLAVIRRLLAQAPRVLVPGGWLVMEIGEGQAGAVRQLAAEDGSYDNDTLETSRDCAGHERVFRARRAT